MSWKLIRWIRPVLLCACLAMPLFSPAGDTPKKPGAPVKKEVEFADFVRKNGGRFWEMTGGEVAEALAPAELVWQDKSQRKAAYMAGKGNPGRIQMGDVNPPEINFEYSGSGKLRRVTAFIYTRGDAKNELDLGNFQKLKRAAVRFAQKITGDESSDDSSSNFGKTTTQSIFAREEFDAVLRVGKGEFITLMLVPHGAVKRISSEIKAEHASWSTLRKRIRRGKNGDVYLEVPMTDQGSKGYCYSATAARILSYYGASVDQHMMAQLLETDRDKGTKLSRALNEFRGNAGKLKLAVNVAFEDYDICRLTYLLSLARKAKQAKKFKGDVKKLKEAELKDDEKAFLKIFSGIDMGWFANRVAGKTERDELYHWVKSEIDAARPMIWLVLFLDPDGSGYHARIINGYNSKTKEIIYTDSWGKGHEKEKMSLEEARAITVQLLTVTSRL